VYRAPAAPSPKEKPAPSRGFPNYDGKLLRKQKAIPAGGKVILYSRNRHGNYPLASYAFQLGLRGDDERVRNHVNLVFGNGKRENSFTGERIDSVPGGTGGAAGAVGMDSRSFHGKRFDEFRVGCYGGCQHRIVDLGKVDYGKVRIPASLCELPDEASHSGHARVEVGHVYVIHLYYPGRPDPQDLYVKLKVLAHRDNDAVLFEWQPLPLPRRTK
jgi:hypothetical protein